VYYRHSAIVFTFSLIAIILPPWAAGADSNGFYYYPAYGAQRGKIVYRDGPLVNRQKIRWGNGLTEYGAGVLNNAIGAAIQIVPAVVKDETPADAKSNAATIALPAHYTTELSRANNLLERSARLLGHDISTDQATGTESPAVADGDYRNSPDPWGDENAATNATGVAEDQPATDPAISSDVRGSADPWKD
jgi:hypothetical protein